jgi:antitoxin component YwqK of YwqJK toxin-antitoxin module
MAQELMEVTRRYFPATGMFVFYVNGKEVAKKWRDAGGEMKIEGVIPNAVIKTYFEDANGNETGKLFAEWSYRNGRLDGTSRLYNEEGDIIEELSYQNGKIEAIIKKDYDKGQLCYESTLHSSNGQVTFKEF